MIQLRSQAYSQALFLAVAFSSMDLAGSAVTAAALSWLKLEAELRSNVMKRNAASSLQQ